MANETKYFKTPFAESGNRSEVPNISTGGAVGFDTGFGPDYELPQGQVNRKRIERDLYNGLHHSITSNIKQWQENLYPTWIEDDGTGAAFSYHEGMGVSHNDVNYVSLEDGNQEEPGTGNKWEIKTSLINDLSQTYNFNSVAEYKAFTKELPAGKRVYLADRDADFTVIIGTGSANTFNIIASDNVSQSISLILDPGVSYIENWGATEESTFDSKPAIQAAFDDATAKGIPYKIVKSKLSKTFIGSKVIADSIPVDLRNTELTCMSVFSSSNIIDVIGVNTSRADAFLKLADSNSSRRSISGLMHCMTTQGAEVRVQGRKLDLICKITGDLTSGNAPEKCAFYVSGTDSTTLCEVSPDSTASPDELDVYLYASSGVTNWLNHQGGSMVKYTFMCESNVRDAGADFPVIINSEKTVILSGILRSLRNGGVKIVCDNSAGFVQFDDLAILSCKDAAPIYVDTVAPISGSININQSEYSIELNACPAGQLQITENGVASEGPAPIGYPFILGDIANTKALRNFTLDITAISLGSRLVDANFCENVCIRSNVPGLINLRGDLREVSFTLPRLQLKNDIAIAGDLGVDYVGTQAAFDFFGRSVTSELDSYSYRKPGMNIKYENVSKGLPYYYTGIPNGGGTLTASDGVSVVGNGSAGVGAQYIHLQIGNKVYKMLHDGLA